MTLAADDGLSRVLNDIDRDLGSLTGDVRKLGEKLDRNHQQTQGQIAEIRETFVKKADYDEDRKTRRAILIAAATIITSIALATWSIIASRPEIVVESMRALGG